MSRQIKFRAWDVENSVYFMPHEICHLDGDLSLSAKENNWIFEQFTGLLDKNGVEIYEGDIVRIGDYDEGVWIDDDVHAINYQADDGYPAFELTPHPGHEMNGLAYVFQSGEQDIEVIGNIHQDKHLLEQQ